MAQASVRCLAAMRPKSGVKPTCQDSSADAFDPERALAPVNCRIANGLFDHLVGGREQRLWYSHTERLRGLEIDNQFEFGRRLYGQFRRLLALEDAIDVARRAAKLIDLIASI